MELAEVLSTAQRLGAIPETRPIRLLRLPGIRPGAGDCYARFLYVMAKALRPTKTLELGTCHGVSGAHLAMGNPEGMVHTIDVDPNSGTHVERLGIPNLKFYQGNTLDRPAGSFQDLDFLFMDTNHTFETSIKEYEIYFPMVRPGGLIFMDDIHYGPEMDRFWDTVREPKVELGRLHFSGFGVVKKP